MSLQERERAESEKAELKMELESEITELTLNLSKLQKLDDQMKQSPSEALKTKVDELTSENRHMRSSMTDGQTNLAILRSEIATLRQQYEEKSEEVERSVVITSALVL